MLDEVVDGGKALTEEHLGVELGAGDLAYVAVVGVIDERALKPKVAFSGDKGNIKIVD